MHTYGWHVAQPIIRDKPPSSTQAATVNIQDLIAVTRGTPSWNSRAVRLLQPIGTMHTGQTCLHELLGLTCSCIHTQSRSCMTIFYQVAQGHTKPGTKWPLQCWSSKRPCSELRGPHTTTGTSHCQSAESQGAHETSSVARP